MDFLFFISALVAVAGTFLLITHRHPIYALLGLLVALTASAGVFLALDAPFIAVAQILIYAGALAVMFLFVLMFTDTRTDEDTGLPKAVTARAVFDVALTRPARIKKKKEGEPSKYNPLRFLAPVNPMALVISLCLLVCATFAIGQLPDSFGAFGTLPTAYDGTLMNPATVTAQEAAANPNYLEYGTTEAVSRTIFEGFPLAFEVVSLLIFAALLGAVLLARRHLAGTGMPGTQDVGKESEHA
ncbi:MAG: NADH-quinone oxidoreductase subunit J [Planctomycetes bacterium]|nr:NADH-quinone oxidoreductase subunit J [Planctomycetota bacterium]